MDEVELLRLSVDRPEATDVEAERTGAKFSALSGRLMMSLSLTLRSEHAEQLE